MINPLSTFSPLVSAGSSGRTPDPARAAEEFEVLLIGQLLDELPMPGLEGTEAGTFLSLVHEALARQLVAQGGLGLAHQLEGVVGRGPEVEPLPHPRVSSAYGLRRDPFDGSLREHHGVDLPAAHGTPISAVRPGVVSFAGARGGLGNLIVVDHDDGLQTAYAHCDTIAVAAGERVGTGTVVGTVGSTGRATGAHLHFEVRQDGVRVDPAAAGIPLARLFASSPDVALSTQTVGWDVPVSSTR